MLNRSSHIRVANVSLPHNESLDICEPWEGSFSVSEKVLITMGYAVLFVFSFFGNTLVIAVFHKDSQLRTPANYFIVNMAVSDLFVPLFVLPRNFKDIYFGWSTWLVGGEFGNILCKVVSYTEEVSMTVSSQSMVFIAAERFWCIVFPMKPPLISKRTAPRFICFTWMFSLLFFVYYFFAYKLTNRGFCNYDLPQIFVKWDDLWRLDRLSVLVTFVVVPFLLTTLFYTAILISLHRKGKSSLHLGSKAELARIKKNRRVALMLVAVMVLFIISWTPYYAFFFIEYYFSGLNMSCDSKTQLYMAGRVINYFYTAINPLLYYTFSTNYRQGFHKLLCCPRSSQTVPVSDQPEEHSTRVELQVVSKRKK